MEIRGYKIEPRANLIRADLIRANLIRANLIRANLIRANLTEANLTGANLTGANLSWANLTVATGIINAGFRSDSYNFIGWIKENQLYVNAGCRSMPIAKAREHWLKTRFDTPLGNESIALCDHIERMAVIRNMIKEQ